jgi:hypothetical protein
MIFDSLPGLKAPPPSGLFLRRCFRRVCTGVPAEKPRHASRRRGKYLQRNSSAHCQAAFHWRGQPRVACQAAKRATSLFKTSHPFSGQHWKPPFARHLNPLFRPSQPLSGLLEVGAAPNAGNCNCSDRRLRARIRCFRVGFPPTAPSVKTPDGHRPMMSATFSGSPPLRVRIERKCGSRATGLTVTPDIVDSRW